ncbi:hypothetical protein [Aeromicrobium sp. Leaf245]|uniref:hypothetical protein n=1 Tax=Aeromicrobium sp. Leaf245 TaxID=1736306 RepID=UPI0006F4E131|nr:hypothetical protein [Aeromicrobium sp. Leaf245]KQO41865.1 hypothetical protein ASF05_12240 [Aeromicrobium sp. Leaf245]
MFEDSHVLFTWAFGVELKGLSGAADRLLGSGMADAVSYSARSNVLLAPEFRQRDRLMRKADDLADVLRQLVELDRVGFRDLLRLSARNPRTIGTLTRVALEAARPRRPVPGSTPDEGQSLQETIAVLEEAAQEIRSTAASAQVYLAALRFFEMRMLRPSYLDRSTAVRVQLRPIKLVVKLAGKRVEQICHPLLLLGSGGVVLVSLQLELPESIETVDLLEALRASEVRLEDAWLAPGLAASSSLASDAQETDAEGWVRLPRSQESMGLGLDDVWAVLQEAVLRAAKLESYGEWLCYPTLQFRAGGCCRSHQSWRKKHENDLANILLKLPDRRSLTRQQKEAVPPDTSFMERSSLWHSQAITVSLSAPDEVIENQIERFATAQIVVEIFLIQLMSLRVLSDALAVAAGQGLRGLRQHQLRLILALEEFDHPVFSYGSASDDASRMLEAMGASGTRARLRDRVSDLGSLIAVGRSEKSASRGVWLAAAALVVALVFSVPSLAEAVRELRTVPAGTPFLGSLLAPLREGEVSAAVVAAWGVVSALAGLAILPALLNVARRARVVSFPLKRRRHAHRWSEGTITILDRGEPGDL